MPQSSKTFNLTISVTLMQGFRNFSLESERYTPTSMESHETAELEAYDVKKGYHRPKLVMLILVSSEGYPVTFTSSFVSS